MAINKMSSTKAITAILLFVSQIGWAKTDADKRDIYNTVIREFADKSLPIVNETFTRMYKYDIDGDHEKWFYQRGNETVSDTSFIVGSTICLNPVRYTRSVTDFLKSMDIGCEPTIFLNQVNEAKLDSLSRYTAAFNLISWSKAPLAHSAIGNLFKTRKVIGLSQIFFDERNKLALVKLQVYSKSRLCSENTSRLIIMRQIDTIWTFMGILDEKQQPTAGLVRMDRFCFTPKKGCSKALIKCWYGNPLLFWK